MSNFIMTTFGHLGELQGVEFWLDDDDQADDNWNNSNNMDGDVFTGSGDPNSNNNNSNDDLNSNNSNSNADQPHSESTPVKKIHIDKVSIADVKKSERYFFACDLVIDNSGRYQKNKAVPAAMENSVKNFWFLFNNHAKRGIFDDHLWLSTFKVSVVHQTYQIRL